MKKSDIIVIFVCQFILIGFKITKLDISNMFTSLPYMPRLIIKSSTFTGVSVQIIKGLALIFILVVKRLDLLNINCTFLENTNKQTNSWNTSQQKDS